MEITTHPVEMKYNRLLQQAAAGWMEETLGSVSSTETLLDGNWTNIGHFSCELGEKLLFLIFRRLYKQQEGGWRFGGYT